MMEERNQYGISLQSENDGSCVVAELPEGRNLIDYCCKMLENNAIPGLLPVRHQILNGQVRLRYSLAGKVRLGDYLAMHPLTYANGLLILRNLTNSLLRLNEYFLRLDQCVLDVEHIYIGDGLNTYLLCVPVDSREVSVSGISVRRFYEQLIGRYFATMDCADYDEMFKWVHQVVSFDLEEFRKHFLEQSVVAGRTKADSVREKAATEYVPAQPAMGVGEETRPAEPKISEPAEKNPLDKLGALGKISLMDRLNRAGQTAEPPAPEKGEYAEPQDDLFPIPPSQKPEKQEKQEKKEEKKKKKKGLFGFGERKKQAKAEDEMPIPSDKKPAEPVIPPVRPVQPAVPPVSVQSVPPVQNARNGEQNSHSGNEDDWEQGTILVKQDEGTMLASSFTQRAVCAYLVHQGRRINIDTTPFVLGKMNSTHSLNYAIANNNKVSRNHAEILLSGDQYAIKDNQSRNGTFLNGRMLQPLQPVALKDGDEIRLYDEVLVFHLEN